ncbi:hypothetical protein RclHR1_10450002 [Rhizophagus clarus]|uniref:Uncharacterized protein n=1 Tax=Rhizophagus clarus TaxID=94130 RepID=A0A2Z6QDJ7_9GLOM|nr:hypothetical protein RclHR1_10450002 [Rhizophagus clarus]
MMMANIMMKRSYIQIEYLQDGQSYLSFIHTFHTYSVFNIFNFICKKLSVLRKIRIRSVLVSISSYALNIEILIVDERGKSIGNVYQQRTKTTRILNKIRVVLKIGKLRPFSNSSRSFFLCSSKFGTLILHLQNASEFDFLLERAAFCLLVIRRVERGLLMPFKFFLSLSV